MDANIVTLSESNIVDRRMMARCVELSRYGAAEGERPFGSVIARGEEILGQSTNRALLDGDISRHAEIVAITQAHARVGSQKLDDCTLYSTVEPCAMCAFCIREARIGRVVFALASPIMGGLSAWNILGEDRLSDQIPFVFGSPPDVTGGVLADEAAQVWREWNGIALRFIKSRGLIVIPRTERQATRKYGPRSLRHLIRLLWAPASPEQPARAN